LKPQAPAWPADDIWEYECIDMGLNVPSMIGRLALILALTLCAEAKAEIVQAAINGDQVEAQFPDVSNVRG
jgi:hypothetical protein